MPRIQRIFIISTFLFLFSTFAHAQAVPSYLFLEVVDSKQKPVSDAIVESRFYIPNIRQTDRKGKVEMRGLWIGRDSIVSEFNITKTAYFPFQDFGIFSRPRRTIKIELLKIPKTEKERKVLGDEQKKREFIWAIEKGDSETVRNLLKSSISPNLSVGDLRDVSGYENYPAIIFAAVLGDGAMIKTLLEAGADIRKKNDYLSFILFHYLKADVIQNRQPKTEAEKAKLLSEYDEGLKALIKTGIDINSCSNNQVPLIWAIQYDRLNAVKILIASGVNVNPKNCGETPLAVAKAYLGYGDNHPEIVKLLEAAGAK